MVLLIRLMLHLPIHRLLRRPVQAPQPVQVLRQVRVLQRVQGLAVARPRRQSALWLIMWQAVLSCISRAVVATTFGMMIWFLPALLTNL